MCVWPNCIKESLWNTNCLLNRKRQIRYVKKDEALKCYPLYNPMLDMSLCKYVTQCVGYLIYIYIYICSYF